MRFHRILIGAAIALGGVLGVWGLAAYRRTGAVQSLWIAALAVVVSVLLAGYLVVFIRKTSR